MKRRFLISPLLVISFILILTSSCKKDDDLSNPENLSGTTWTTTPQDEGGIFYILIFESKTSVELRQGRSITNSDDLFQGIYSIDRNIITMTTSDVMLKTCTGSIEDSSIKLYIYGEWETFQKK